MNEPIHQSRFAPADLLPMTLEPNWAEQAPEERRVLIVDFRDAASLAPGDSARLQAWLVGQVVPVVGIGPTDSSALQGSTDLVVQNESELRRVTNNIAENPIASAVLVQVLRRVESLDLMQALTLESLAFATLQAGEGFSHWLASYRSKGRPRAQASGDVLVLNRDGCNLDIVLNSPETRNAISIAMRDALTEAFKLVAMDDSITSVHVSAKGPCFSSGGELSEFGTLPDPAAGHMIRMLRMPGRYLAPHAKRYSFHLHRACIGAGIELAAFAARVTASENTFFQLPELGMGLIPGAGGCVSITRRIGRQRTAYMALLGKKIPAARALEWGLIDAIVD